MTYSVVARCPETGHLGVAVASRFFAAGAVVPYLRARAACASQAFANPLWGLEGVRRMNGGEAARAVLAALVAGDEGAGQRQWHGIDAAGRIAAHTGADCLGWAGHATGDGVSVAGNMLAGPAVVADALGAFEAGKGTRLAERLLAAMRAGAAAGGDRRGTQSAGLRVHRAEDFPWIDLRADDHPDPLAELGRLLDVAGERYLPMAEQMPSTAAPSGRPDRALFERRVAEAARRRRGPSRSFATPLAED